MIEVFDLFLLCLTMKTIEQKRKCFSVPGYIHTTYLEFQQTNQIVAKYIAGPRQWTAVEQVVKAKLVQVVNIYAKCNLHMQCKEKE